MQLLSDEATSRRIEGGNIERRPAGIDTLAEGECQLGLHKVDITPESTEPMAGFSWSGSRGRPGEDRLWARVLYIEDAETQKPTLLCIMDLMSASAALLRAIERELEARGRADLQGRLVLSATHTHTGPGRFFGNRFYDRLAAPLSLGGFNARLTTTLAERIAGACCAAAEGARPGTLSVQRAVVWAAGRNRSLAAHRANWTDPEAPRVSWGAPPAELDAEQGAVDPRLTVLCASLEGRQRGVFAWYGCHATAMGRKWKFYHRDWPGFAVDHVEHALPGVLCAVGSGASGDVTPVPSSPRNGRAQGPELAREVGERVARRIVEVARAAPVFVPQRLPVILDAGVFEVRPNGSAPRWQIGVPVLGGSEDGGPSYRAVEFVAEGFRGDSGPQRPKAPALGFLQVLTLGPLDIAPYHPWHRLRLGDHVLCTVPGEPTVMAALELEQEVERELRASSASVIGYAGDYAGYFTTEPEYCEQHYEGASTLYGPRSLEWYREQLLGPCRSRPTELDPSALPHGGIPRRNVQRLLGAAHELSKDGKAIELLFATPREPRQGSETTPRVRLVGSAPNEAAVLGVCRRHAHPDPQGATELETYLAVFDRSQLEAVGLRLFDTSLAVAGAQGETFRDIVPESSATENGRWPPSVGAPDLGGVRRSFLALGLVFGALALTLVMFSPWTFAHLGWSWSSGFEILMARKVGLTCLLLSINFLMAKNSRDQKALSGYAGAATLFAFAIALFAWLVRGSPLVASCFAVLALLSFGLLLRVWPTRGEHPTPPRAHWEFWAPLFWVGLLTLVGGVTLLAWPWLVIDAFDIKIGHPSAHHWLRLYGAGFLVNTVAMWRAQYTRDLQVIRAQLWGSIWFDSIAAILMAVAIAEQLLSPLGLLLLLPFLVIVWKFPELARRARAEAHLNVEQPRTEGELRRIVRDAARARKLVRVVGSSHSVPSAIHGDTAPCPRAARPSASRTVHVSLDHLDALVDVDRRARRICVQAGMRIGVDPGHEPSTHNNLLSHLRGLELALPDLGGIVHQTIAGFLLMGCSGGSLRHAFQDSVVELRFVDASGRVQVARRGAAGREGELFDALLVSMGLLGIVTEVTFECEPAYQVRGREHAARVEAGVAKLRPSAAAASREIVLSSAGPDGLAEFLRETEYCRILWWPQAGISSMAIWEAERTDTSPGSPSPYKPPAGIKQWVAGRFLDVLGYSYGVGNRGVVGNWLRRKLLPPFARQFIPKKPIPFHASWDVNLPMDTNVDQAFLPVEFTELWFDIESTGAVMQTLLDAYAADPNLAGTFTVELYVAKSSTAWLSPSYQRDSFRVDIFWYQRNAGDPVLDYYPKFYTMLEQLAFRVHWAKYLPEPGSPQGPSYLARQYPRWNDFLALRAALDPHGTFLSTYWRRQLGLH